MMVYMFKKIKKSVFSLKQKMYCITAFLLGAVFVSALIFSLRAMDPDILILSDVGVFAIYFFVFFIVLFFLSFLTAMMFYKFDLTLGIAVIALFAVPLVIPPDLCTVIFDLFFSPREGFLAYIGDKYSIDFVNDLILSNYSIYNFSFIAYAWKITGSMTMLIYFVVKNTNRKDYTGLFSKVSLLFRILSFALILFVAFIHQIPVMIASYVSRYEFAYSFPDCFTLEIFTFFYSAVFAVIIILFLFSIIKPKRTCLK